MSTPGRSYTDEFRTEVVEAFCEVRDQYPSISAAGMAVARRYDVSLDSVRRWANDAGEWQAHNTVGYRRMQAELEDLRARYNELRRRTGAGGVGADG